MKYLFMVYATVRSAVHLLRCPSFGTPSFGGRLKLGVMRRGVE
jgi:hypothetical protein